MFFITSGEDEIFDVLHRLDLACASLIIADRADGDIKLLRKLQLRQPGGCRASRMMRADSGWGWVDIRFISIQNIVNTKKERLIRRS